MDRGAPWDAAKEIDESKVTMDALNWDFVPVIMIWKVTSERFVKGVLCETRCNP